MTKRRTTNRTKTILMIVENVYKGDTRVQKEVGSLRQFFEIVIISQKGPNEKIYTKNEAITHIRIPILKLPFSHSKTGIFSREIFLKTKYIIEYFYFTTLAHLIFLCTFPIYRFKIIHVHNPPDTFFLLGALSKLIPGVKFIFDHHDLSPELYLTRFGGNQDFLYKLLITLEKFSCKTADIVIATNESYKIIEKTRHGIPDEKIHIVRNDPFKELVNRSSSYKKTHNSDEMKILYLGSINPQDGIDHLLRALYDLREKYSYDKFKCIIIGDGDSLHSAKKITEVLSLQKHVLFKGYIYDREELFIELLECDVCVEPAPINPLNQYSTFIKIMEYMAGGKPIVAYDLRETRFSSNGCALLARPGDPDHFSNLLHDILINDELRGKLAKKGQERILSKLNWEVSESILLSIYSDLY